jgi:hypothetical protein
MSHRFKVRCPEWAEWQDHFQGNICHSIDWAETRRSADSDPLYVQWQNENSACLDIARGIGRRSPARNISQFIRRLFFETYPAAKDNNVELTRSMIKQLADSAKQGDVEVSQSSPLARPSWPLIKAD